MKLAAVIMLLVVLGIMALYLFMLMPRMLHRPDKTPFIGWLYAHRGLHDNASGAPENSMAAFKKAVEAGYGIELDIQLTKDKIPVIFHDFTLVRMCGAPGKIADYTYGELQEFHLKNSTEKIPAFSEFLKLVDGRVPFVLEYKMPGNSTEICRIADGMLRDYNGVYCIESFHPLVLLWYRRHRSRVMRGQLADNFVKDGETALPGIACFLLHNMLFDFLVKPDFIAYNHKYYKDLSRRILRYLYGTLSVAWTIKSEKELKERKEDFDLFIFDSFIPSPAIEK